MHSIHHHSCISACRFIPRVLHNCAAACPITQVKRASREIVKEKYYSAAKMFSQLARFNLKFALADNTKPCAKHLNNSDKQLKRKEMISMTKLVPLTVIIWVLLSIQMLRWRIIFHLSTQLSKVLKHHHHCDNVISNRIRVPYHIS